MLLGELDRARSDDNAQPIQFNISEMIKHPNFTSRHKYNDIALIKLDGFVEFNEYVRPACLPELDSIGFYATATGWGRLDSNGPLSSHLQKVELDLFTHGECNDLYAMLNNRYINKGILNETQLCAGSHYYRGDTCQVSWRTLPFK